MTTVDTTAIEQKSAELTAKIEVVTQDDYLKAAALRFGAKELIAEIDATWDPLIAESDSHTKSLRSTKRGFREPLEQAIHRIDVAMQIFELEQKRLAALAEAQIADDVVAAAKEERAAEVNKLARLGYVQESIQLDQKPIETPLVPIVPVKVPKVEGLSTRTLWSAEVTDLMALVKAVAAGKVPIEALQPNMTVLNTLAVAARSTLAIPGVKAVSRSIKAQRKT